jgi:hypothetical protein
MGPRKAARCSWRGALHPRRLRLDVHRAASGRCASTRASATPRQTNERFKFLLNAGQTGLSCAFDLPTQMGYDSDAGRAEGEVGKVGVAIDSMEDMRLLLADLPLDKVTTSMTINSTAAILLLMYELVAEENGVSSRPDRRHDPERPAQGVHRTGHLRVSAAPVDADHHRHLRLLQPARPELEHDLDLRLPHPRGRLDGGAGDRVHAGQRDRLRAGGDRRRPRRRRLRTAAVVLLERPQQLLRRGRQVPREPPDVAHDHDRAIRCQGTRSRRCCASTPRPAARRSRRSSR